jgi:hypothetical protein
MKRRLAESVVARVLEMGVPSNTSEIKKTHESSINLLRQYGAYYYRRDLYTLITPSRKKIHRGLKHNYTQFK